jgi:hypothetical protein
MFVDHERGNEAVTVLVSPRAEVLHVWSAGGLLEVPYGRRGRAFVERLRHFIPSPSASTQGGR